MTVGAKRLHPEPRTLAGPYITYEEDEEPETDASLRHCKTQHSLLQ